MYKEHNFLFCCFRSISQIRGKSKVLILSCLKDYQDSKEQGERKMVCLKYSEKKKKLSSIVAHKISYFKLVSKICTTINLFILLTINKE